MGTDKQYRKGGPGRARLGGWNPKPSGLASSCRRPAVDLIDVRAELEVFLRQRDFLPLLSDRPSSDFVVTPWRRSASGQGERGRWDHRLRHLRRTPSSALHGSKVGGRAANEVPSVALGESLGSPIFSLTLPAEKRPVMERVPLHASILTPAERAR